MTTELNNAEAFTLLDRVAAGDERAFRRLYERSSRRIYAFAMHRLRDAVAAEEVVSEVLYEVWRRPRAFLGTSQFSTWLLGIARHRIQDRWRAAGRAQPHEDLDDHLHLADDAAGNGFDALAQQQRAEGVATCMDRLGEPHRECLYLVFYEGLSQAEISALQQVGEGTVKTRLFHARAKIKRCLHALLHREGACHV